MFKRVAVSSSCSQLGAWVVKALVDRGHAVAALTQSTGNVRYVPQLQTVREGQVEVRKCSYGFVDEMKFALDGCDALVYVLPPLSAGTLEGDVRSGKVRTLMDEAVHEVKSVITAGVGTVRRTVFVSSLDSMLDPRNAVLSGESWADEPTALRAQNWNALYAMKCEREALLLNKKRALRMRVLNPSMMLGPSLDITVHSPLLAHLLAAVFPGRFPKPAGALVQALAVTDIRDVALMAALALERDLIGSGSGVRVPVASHWVNLRDLEVLATEMFVKHADTAAASHRPLPEPAHHPVVSRGPYEQLIRPTPLSSTLYSAVSQVLAQRTSE